MNKNLEKIIKSCHVACPELLELGLGCKVIACGNTLTIVQDYNGFGVWEHLGGSVDEGDIDEIIGHPPQLSHVLRTFKKNIFVDNEGFLLLDEGDSVGQDLYRKAKWNLEKDLLGQSEPTINFISSLL